MSDDPDYHTLDKQISGLESAIKGKGDLSMMFSQLREAHDQMSDKPEKDTKKLEKAVDKMFEKFPPRSA